MAQEHPRLRLLFFYGKGGAGKDTEAERLARDNSHWAIISTGDRIKQAQDPNDEFHSIVAPHVHLIKEGKNLPIEVVFNAEEPSKSIIPAFIESELRKGSPVTTIISTGFPRTLAQLHALDEYLKGLRQNVDVSEEHFYFDVSDETSLRRILGRPAEYLTLGKPVRNDDNEIAARTRLRVFVSDTLPIVEELRTLGKIHEIFGEGTKSQTHTLVEEVLFPKPALEIFGNEVLARPPRERR